jgi:hypothetical protein
MTFTREHGLWAFGAAVIVAAGLWIARNTEWADVDVPDPPSTELMRDPDRHLKELLAKLGARVNAPQNLDHLPPNGATLVLNSWNWDLFPERGASLERWVEAGGQLVLPNFGFGTDKLKWVPAKVRSPGRPAVPSASPPAKPVPTEDDDDGDEDRDTDKHETPKPPPAAAPTPPAPKSLRCPGLNEPEGVSPAYAFARGYSTCMSADRVLQTDAPLQWALDGPHGHVMLRLPFGRGSVTLAPTSLPTGNGDLLERDNALIAVAALQVRTGREVWLVRDEKRAPLLSFLWQRGAPAVLLGLAALAFALWRGAKRFGPRVAVAPLARRSMAEQIRGTAAFIAQRGSPALHAAQMRALNATAAPRIGGFEAMLLGERAQAIARVTGLDPHALAHAMNPTLAATPTRHPAAALALIETARRRLLNASLARR